MFTDEDILEEIMNQYLSFETELKNFYEKCNTISQPDWEFKRRALQKKCYENESQIIAKVKELEETKSAKVKKLRPRDLHAARTVANHFISQEQSIDVGREREKSLRRKLVLRKLMNLLSMKLNQQLRPIH